MSQADQVILVGHCGPDTYMLKFKVEQVLPNVPVKVINDEKDLEGQLTGRTLLLINRVLDGGIFEPGTGIDLIGRLTSQADVPKMMLISDFADAQAQAVMAGALQGFGKSELGKPQTEQLLQGAFADEGH